MNWPQTDFHLFHGSLKAACSLIAYHGCQSLLHFPPIWWRSCTKVSSPVHHAHKRHNKSSCRENSDPSAATGHNKFPPGSITHGPEPRTTTHINLTLKKNLLIPASSFPLQAAFYSELIQVVSTARQHFARKNRIISRIKQQTPWFWCRAGFTDCLSLGMKIIGKQFSDTVALNWRRVLCWTLNTF